MYVYACMYIRCPVLLLLTYSCFIRYALFVPDDGCRQLFGLFFGLVFWHRAVEFCNSVLATLDPDEDFLL